MSVGFACVLSGGRVFRAVWAAAILPLLLFPQWTSMTTFSFSASSIFLDVPLGGSVFVAGRCLVRATLFRHPHRVSSFPGVEHRTSIRAAGSSLEWFPSDDSPRLLIYRTGFLVARGTRSTVRSPLTRGLWLGRGTVVFGRRCLTQPLQTPFRPFA